MLDLADPCQTMQAVGREDRALLRSNPSARSDAGRWTGASARRALPPSQASLGPKAINLCPEGQARRTAIDRELPHRSDICLDLRGYGH